MPLKSFYRAALLCGLVPLATLALLFLRWVITHGPAYELAVLMTILVQIVSVLVGVWCLSTYAYRSSRTEHDSKLAFRVLIAAVILLANYPATHWLVSNYYDTNQFPNWQSRPVPHHMPGGW